MFDINPQIQKWILSVISVFAEQTTEFTAFRLDILEIFRAKLNTQLVKRYSFMTSGSISVHMLDS